MKIFMTCPNPKNPHGGLRVIFKWAEYLSMYHEVTLFLLGGNKPKWYNINPDVIITGSFESFHTSDCVILTSPHSADFIDLILPQQKAYLFLQMDEYMFNPGDANWFRMCKKFYQAPIEMFCISNWVINKLKKIYNRIAPATHYISNGIDTELFPIVKTSVIKDDKIVLIEGFEPGANPTKDSDRISAAVALRLKNDGYKVYAYSQASSTKRRECLTEYISQPPLELLNELYERASVLIKASKYDARSTSPIEAMTKGTPTVRAIIEGDDDLIHLRNSIRVPYSEELLYHETKALLLNADKRNRLAENGFEHLQQNCNWGKIMSNINDKISS